MTLNLKILAVLIGVALFACIIELVRRRRLREEYSWIWLLTGCSIVVLSLWYDLLQYVGALLGGVLPSAVLFFFGLIFLLLICLYQSITISRLSDQVKELAQELAIARSRSDDA